jgi:hypothetical protein
MVRRAHSRQTAIDKTRYILNNAFSSSQNQPNAQGETERHVGDFIAVRFNASLSLMTFGGMLK